MNIEESFLTRRISDAGFGADVQRYPNMMPGRAGGAAIPVSGAVGWWDAMYTEGMTFGNGRAITQINDRSGNANHMTQSTLGAQAYLTTHPTYFRRLPVLAFDGAVNYASSVDASDRTQTMFFVGLCHAFTTTPTLVGPSADGGRQLRADSDGTLAMIKSGTSYMLDSTLTVTAGAPFVVCCKLDTSAIEIRLDRQTAQTNGDSTTFTASRTTHLGWKGTPGDPQALYGLIAEVVIFPTALVSGDIDLMMAYLLTKWGI